MSFSSEIKEELSKFNTYSNRELLEFEMIGYLISNATVRENNIVFLTENSFNARRIGSILNKLFNYEYQESGENSQFKIICDANIFESIGAHIGPGHLWADKYVSIIQNKFILANQFRKEINEDILKHRAFLRGVFMGTGSVNNPNVVYHLEIDIKSEQNCIYVCDLINKLEINAKIVEKKKEFIIYIKEGEHISHFLALIGAYSSVLRFEEIRVVKDIRNNVNRLVNCETANLIKTVEAAVSSVEDIKYIKRKKQFENMPEQLKEIAEIRMKYKDKSLKELGEILENPISKSGVNHRLRKISEFAKELRLQNG